MADRSYGKSLMDAGAELIRALEQVVTNPIAIQALREKLPSNLLRKPKEIQSSHVHMNKVKGRGKGWNHHK